jgi:hypothetical protein
MPELCIYFAGPLIAGTARATPGAVGGLDSRVVVAPICIAGDATGATWWENSAPNTPIATSADAPSAAPKI